MILQKILSVFLMAVMLLPNSLVMLKDTALMGIDYISLTPNEEKVTAKKVAEAVRSRTDSNIFVLTDDKGFEELKKKYTDRSDEKLNEYFDYVKKCADNLMDVEPHGYILDKDEDAILETARAILERVVVLGFMWRMTGKTEYAVRCRAEILNACAFEDWHEWHYLDTAELSFAMSLGTNWLYDFLSEDDVRTVYNSVQAKAFDTSEGKILSQNWWKWSKTNWNSVCYAGLATAAMVFYDYCEDFAADFLADTYNNMAYNFETFTPDGVYVEGSGYWEYCTTYLTYFISTSDIFIGTDFGLSETDGFMELGAFPLYITGATSVFNYGDNKKVSIGAPSLYWFSKKTGRPELAYYQARASVDEELEKGKGEYELAKECAVGALWFDSSLLEGFNPDDFGKSVCLKSDSSQEIAVFRSGWFDENATYAAIKGGYNYTNHGDLDIGTFVFDSQGVRWAEELGPADYGDNGYFVGICGGGRWKVYAKRAEGQNTLVFNPDSIYEDQYPFARATISDFKETADGGKATLNTSDAYRFNGVLKSNREFELYNNRTSLRIKDTFRCATASEVYWFMHTKADIQIVDDHTAILTIGDKHLMAKLSDDSCGKFMVMEPVSLKDGMDNRLKGDWTGLKKLTVYADGVTAGVIEVSLEPYNVQ